MINTTYKLEKNKAVLQELVKFWRHPELDALDAPLRTKRSLADFLSAIGLTTAGLAERMQVSRQAVHQYIKGEESGAITLATLQNIAQACDCEFVYGFVPQKHDTFAEMMTDKTLAFVEAPPMRGKLSKNRVLMAYGSRIQKFLSQPTGCGQVWGLKKALRREYSWFWAGIKR